jgi:hypothetical protein
MAKESLWYFVNNLDKDKTMDNVQGYNICTNLCLFEHLYGRTKGTHKNLIQGNKFLCHDSSTDLLNMEYYH